MGISWYNETSISAVKQIEKSEICHSSNSILLTSAFWEIATSAVGLLAMTWYLEADCKAAYTLLNNHLPFYWSGEPKGCEITTALKARIVTGHSPVDIKFVVNCCNCLHNSSYPHYPQVNPQMHSGKPLSNQGEFCLYQKISTGLHKPVEDFIVNIKPKVTIGNKD